MLREPVRLTDHYRSTAGVIGLCDELCGYNLRVHTQSSSLSDLCPTLRGPLLFTPVDGQQMRTRGSWYNDAEVAQVVEWLFHLFEHGINTDRIAVLTPYVGQLDALRGVLHRRGISTVDQPGLSLTSDERLPIGTVHQFQGGERDIILYSSVVTTARSLQFQNQRVNLLNVAVSRARKHFTVGRRCHFSRSLYPAPHRTVHDSSNEPRWFMALIKVCPSSFEHHADRSIGIRFPVDLGITHWRWKSLSCSRTKTAIRFLGEYS